MNNGRNLDLKTMLETLRDQKNASRDFLVTPGALRAVAREKGGFDISMAGEKSFTPSGWAAGQLSTISEVPKAYADRLAEYNPELLADCLNDGLSRVQGMKLLRTVGDRARAIVSDSYFALDAFDLLRETLPVIYDGGFQVQQSEISERRLYIRAVTPKVQADVKVGDPVQFGIALSTSDVGGGALKVEPFFHRLQCLNGMVMERSLFGNTDDRRKVSVYSKHGARKIEAPREISFEGGTFAEFLTDETRQKKAAAIFSETRDMITGLANPEKFRELVEIMRRSAETKIGNHDIQTVVARAMAEVSVVGKEMALDIIAELVNGNQGAGFTQWGLANSFTAQAHKAEDADKADMLMRAGGRIIALNETEWKKVAC